MQRFLAGLLAGLVAGGVIGWRFLPRDPAPAAPQVVVTEGPTPPPKKGGKRAPRTQGNHTVLTAPADPTITLTSADLRSSTEGDALHAGAVSLDMSQAGSEPRDLSQDEIDAAFGRRSDALIACITDARAGAPVTGRVIAGVVAGADGRVVRTRIEAPAWLLRHGLYPCARRVLLGVRFPAAGKESVITVPFDISE